MNASVILDSLIAISNETTLFFDNRDCPISLVKEAILRGFQVMNCNPLYSDSYSFFLNGRGEWGGSGWGAGEGCGNGWSRVIDHYPFGNRASYGYSIGYGFEGSSFDFEIEEEEVPELVESHLNSSIIL